MSSKYSLTLRCVGPSDPGVFANVFLYWRSLWPNWPLVVLVVPAKLGHLQTVLASVNGGSSAIRSG